MSLSLKTAKLAWLNLLLARGDFESPVCFHVNLDNLVQSSGKLTNQKGRGHNLRPNVHCNQGAARLLSIALVKLEGFHTGVVFFLIQQIFILHPQMPGSLPRTGDGKMKGCGPYPQRTHSLLWFSSDRILHWGKYSVFWLMQLMMSGE